MELDCLTATVDDIRSLNANFSTSISMESAIVAGFAGWFDVHFRVCFVDNFVLCSPLCFSLST